MRAVVALLLCVLAVVSADTPVPYNDCGSAGDKAKLTSITATNWPPVKGNQETLTINGNLLEQLTAATYSLTVSFDGITILSQNGDLCTLSPNFKCPHASGAFQVSQSLTVPTIAPSGSYAIQIKAVDGSGNELLCLTANFNIQAASLDANAPAITQELVDYVNNLPGNTWTAGFNKRFDQATLKHVQRLCGSRKTPASMKLPVKRATSELHLSLPTNYDPRVTWGTTCPSIKQVRDQGSCGSCYVFGSVEAMTDRICIKTNGTNQAWLSAEDPLSCCSIFCGMGCDGGYPSGVYSYWQSTGIVTGGPWNSKQGCYPYQVEACDHHVVGKLPPCGQELPTPPCQQTCQNGAVWANDKHFGASSYSVSSDPTAIMQEIYTNGPVTAAFTVYADFVSYKSGVYKHVSGEELGGHAIKILGWGVENNTPYWLVANSWNADWGDAGFFKIARGTDECGIEDDIVAGIPK